MFEIYLLFHFCSSRQGKDTIERGELRNGKLSLRWERVREYVDPREEKVGEKPLLGRLGSGWGWQARRGAVSWGGIDPSCVYIHIFIYACPLYVPQRLHIYAIEYKVLMVCITKCELYCMPWWVTTSMCMLLVTDYTCIHHIIQYVSKIAFTSYDSIIMKINFQQIWSRTSVMSRFFVQCDRRVVTI